MATETAHRAQNAISLVRAAIAGGLAFGLVFVACWVGAFAHIAASHMLVQIFTAQSVTSTGALLEGTIWAIVFGGLTSLLAALFYDEIPVGRR